MPSAKAILRAREKAVMQDRVQAALEAARRAADAAIEGFIAKSAVGRDGLISDECGHSVIWVTKPGYDFRTTLQALGATSSWGDGRWDVSHFGPGQRYPCASQSSRASELACRAAIAVLRAHFPEERFSIHNWID